MPLYFGEDFIAGEQFNTVGYKKLTVNGVSPDKTGDIDLASSGIVVNPNLLDNWYFANPVNRSCLTAWSGSPKYTIDRWRICTDYASVTLEDGFLRVSGNDVNGYGGIEQPLSDALLDNLAGRSVTLSMLAKTYTTVSFGGSSRFFEADDTQFKLYTATIEELGHSQFVLIRAEEPVTSGQPIIDIKAVKVEIGDRQTLAYLNADGNWVLHAIPSCPEEYAKCAQYSSVDGAFIGQTHVNRNLLDNAYFVGGGTAGYFPVNQRGQTTYLPEGDSYLFDRWQWVMGRDTGNTIELVENGLKLNGAIADVSNCVIDGRFMAKGLSGKAVTMSVMVEEIDGFLVYQMDGVGGYGVTEPGLYSYTTTLAPDSNDVCYARLYMGGLGTAVISAVKVELGDRQTLGHLNADGTWSLNEVPDYGEELRKCQRYLVRFGPDEWGTAQYAQGGGLVVTVPISMRTLPTLSSSAIEVYVGGTWHETTVYSTVMLGTYVQLRYTAIESVLEAGHSYLVRNLPMLSAEL